jgi:hypothetical protein
MSTYADVHATTLGSTMGASTKIEVISDRELIIRVNDLKEEIEELQTNLEKIDKVVDAVKAQLAAKQEVSPEQMQYLKQATVNKPIIARNIRDKKDERERLRTRIEKNKRACIRVEGVVYSGVEVLVKDAHKIQHEQVSHCRFIREGADVKMVGL